MATATSRWRALAALLRPDSRRWVGLGLSVALASGLSLAGPLVVRRIIDMAADGAAAEQLTSLALLYLALAIATQLITVVVSWFATVTAWHTTNQIRLQLAGHVLGLDHVDDATELMHPMTSTRTDLGPGDLQGLYALGTGPCRPEL